MTLATQPDDVYLKLLGKLDQMAQRYGELERLISDPEIMQDNQRYRELVKEHGRLGHMVGNYQTLRDLDARIADARTMIESTDTDPELAELAAEELEDSQRKKERIFAELIDLWTRDEESGSSSVMMEIRAGTGGDEAALFAGDLFRMYQRYAEKHGWKVEMVDSSPTDLKGFREVIVNISGKDVYQKLRYESGGHRVQRVPVTESQGRIHTSLATVAVMPEVEDVSIEINKEDLDIQRIRSSGPGGQKVNKTSSCVRVVHKPTGVTVRCQDEKSQFRNLDRALKLLATKLHAMKEEKLHQSREALRRSKVGSGDRNERIRTYNFPQDRVTDHRIGFDVFGIERILMGELDDLVDALAQYDRQERLKAFAEEN